MADQEHVCADDVAPMPADDGELAPMPRVKGLSAAKVSSETVEKERDTELFEEIEAEAEETEREMVAVERELAEVEARREYRERAKLDKIPVLGAAALEKLYIKAVEQAAGASLDLKRWLPSFKEYRPLVPGELVTIIGGTGQGKTSILASIAMAIRPMPVLLFEIELPPDAIFERLASMDRQLTGREVENAYRLGDGLALKPLEHIFICPLPRVSVQSIYQVIQQAELKMGVKPQVVMIDYIQLIAGKAGSRYERMADTSEELKRIARATGTVVIATSQRVEKRGEEYVDPEVFLHSARGASEIENSSQLILGIWQDTDRPNTMFVKVIKCTRGKPGLVIECNWHPNIQRLTERAKEEE